MKRMRYRKKKIILSGSLIIIAAFFTMFIITAPTRSNYSIINSLEGNVEIKREGKILGLFSVKEWTKLEEDEELSEGDIVRTGNNGKLEIIFNGNIYIRVDNNSRIIIGKDEVVEAGNNNSLYLNSGRVWAKVKKIYQELTNFEVITPSAVAGVRGTLFSVYTDGKETTLSVREGIVNLSNKDGENNQLVIGEQMGIVLDGRVTLEEEYNEEEKNTWNNKGVKEWINKVENNGIDKAVKGKAVKDKVVKDKAVKNKTVKDKTVKNKAVKNKAVKNKAVKNKTVKDKTVKDKVDKEKEK